MATKKEYIRDRETVNLDICEMEKMIVQIKTTVSDIWADSYQKDDMIIALAELERIFKGTK
jgi:hypothetical protein